MTTNEEIKKTATELQDANKRAMEMLERVLKERGPVEFDTRVVSCPSIVSVSFGDDYTLALVKRLWFDNVFVWVRLIKPYDGDTMDVVLAREYMTNYAELFFGLLSPALIVS